MDTKNDKLILFLFLNFKDKDIIFEELNICYSFTASENPCGHGFYLFKKKISILALKLIIFKRAPKGL